MTPSTVEWGVAAKQMPGEVLSGDLHLVKSTDKGTLVAVADGLGHGKEAADAARLALEAVGRHAHSPLAKALEQSSQELHRTRGVVISMAFLNALDGAMDWLGVGNVEGWLLRPPANGDRTIESLICVQGVVGRVLPPLRADRVNVAPGDTLVFATDGIRRGFETQVRLSGTPLEIAQGILARDYLGTDDALVLVVAYKGRPR